MADSVRRRLATTQLATNWNGNSPVSMDCLMNQGISQHQLVIYATGTPAVGVCKIEVRPQGASFYVPIGTIDLTQNGTGTMIFCALLDNIRLSFPGGISAGMSIGATVYSTGLFFTVGDDYLSETDRRRVVSTMITLPGGWNGSGTASMETPNNRGVTQHQFSIAGGTGMVELQGRPQGGTQFVSIDVQTKQIDSSGMMVIFAGMFDAFRLVPQGVVTGTIQAQISSVGELLFFNNVAQGTYGDATHVPVITVNGGGQITSITVVPINVAAALGYTPIGQFNGRSGTGSPPNITLLSSDVTGALGYTPANTSTFMSSYKNKIINGNFDFWQRGTSLANATLNTLLADRWREIGVGTTIAPSQQAFTLGQTSVPGEPTYFHRTIVTSVAGTNNLAVLQQNIESVRTFAGQTAIASFWAKADATKNMALEFAQNFGSGGSPSTQVNSIGVTTINLTTAWQKFYIVVNVPSISGKSIGTNNNDYLQMNFWFDAGSANNARTNSLGQQSGTFDISEVQVEPDNQNHLPTPFEFRPPQIELALCQRYYEKSYDLNVAPGTVSGNGRSIAFLNPVASNTYSFGAPIQFAVNKRSVPAITMYSPNTGASGKVTDGGFADVTPTIPNIGTRAAYWYAAQSAARTTIDIEAHWTADAEL